MATASRGAFRYVVSQLPSNIPDGLRVFAVWVYNELRQIQVAGQKRKFVEMEVLYAAPKDPEPGWVVYADGSSWNPGSGEGVYRRTTLGTWAFVG